MVGRRHGLAVEALGLRGSEQVLEIGCGQGVATRLVLERLTDGTVTALDRSTKMITALGKAVRDDRLLIRAEALEDAEWGERRFDAILAVNVDLEQRLGDRWAPLLKTLLAPGGKLVLVFEAPRGSDKAAAFLQRAAGRLKDAGMGVERDDKGDLGVLIARLY